jgi:hypothetical protein
MESVPVSMRLSGRVRWLLKELSARDHRTMAGYVSALVEREAEGKQLVFDESAVVAKAKKEKDVVDVSDIVLPDFIDPSLFNDWCEYKKNEHKQKITMSWLRYTIRELTKAHENGWDIEELIEAAIANSWKGCVFDKHKTTECEDGVSDKPITYSKRESEFIKLRSFEAFRDCSQDLFNQFLDALEATDREVTYAGIQQAFSIMCMKLRNHNKVDEMLKSMIETGFFDIDDDGSFEILQGA